jgi:hypothetical protein
MGRTRAPISMSPVHLVSRFKCQDCLVISNTNPIYGVNSVQVEGNYLLVTVDHLPVYEPIHCLLGFRVVLDVMPVAYQLWRDR